MRIEMFAALFPECGDRNALGAKGRTVLARATGKVICDLVRDARALMKSRVDGELEIDGG